MSINLYPYQERLIGDLRNSMLNHRRVLAVSPTASGKTIMFSHLADKVSEKKKRVTILVHREELLEQTAEKLAMTGVEHGIIANGYPQNNNALVQIASVFTLEKRLDKYPHPNLLIVDEAHHAINSSTWGRVINYYDKSYCAGFTATPQRQSGEGLGETFEDMVMGPSVRELIDWGKHNAGGLADYKLFAPKIVDTLGMKISRGDFVTSEMEERVDRPTVTGDCIKHYRAIGRGMPAIAFCVSIAHAQHVAQQFREAGFTAASVDGKMDKRQRRQILQDFKSGLLNVLTSCDLISEGFDCPGAFVGIMLRPTESLALWLQQVGRILRKFDGKEFGIILDHAGNAMRHGLPCEDHAWTLASSKDRKNSSTTAKPISLKVCPKCHLMNRAHAEGCVHCGALFAEGGRYVKQVAGELEELTKETFKTALERQAAMTDRRARLNAAVTLDEVRKLAHEFGYKKPDYWALNFMRMRKLALAKRGKSDTPKDLTSFMEAG